MEYNPTKHDRRSIRLKNYNYSQKGAYFVTICTYNKKCLFGDVVDGNMSLSSVGRMAKQFWREIPRHFPNVQLDEYVVMPNHVHGIIILANRVGAQNFEPLRKKYSESSKNKYQHIIPKSISSIIRAYKSVVTHWCKNDDYTHFKWQRNYYEHIIRNEEDLNEIRGYIINNPLKWELDEENPENCP